MTVEAFSITDFINYLQKVGVNPELIIIEKYGGVYILDKQAIALYHTGAITFRPVPLIWLRPCSSPPQRSTPSGLRPHSRGVIVHSPRGRDFTTHLHSIPLQWVVQETATLQKFKPFASENFISPVFEGVL